MAEMKNFRAVAEILPIRQLYFGIFINGDENNASYLSIKNDRRISRVNLIGTIVMREDLGSITIIKIDDGSDVINTRFFEANKKLDEIEIGSVVVVIGKIREYNNERYIAAEIIKKINPRWLKHRSLLLQPKLKEDNQQIIVEETLDIQINEQINKLEVNNSTEKITETISKEEEAPVNNNNINANDNNSVVQTEIEEENKETTTVDSENDQEVGNENPYLELMSLISSLDTGGGVALEVVVSKSNFENTSELLQKMMESGDIFQNVPGKVKVL